MESCEHCQAAERETRQRGGLFVFKRNRFSLYIVHDNLASGATLDNFYEWYEIAIVKVIPMPEHEAKELCTNRFHAPAH